MEYLVKNGVRYQENGISVTHSKHSGKTWYLTETANNMRLLNKYRKNIISK